MPNFAEFFDLPRLTPTPEQEEAIAAMSDLNQTGAINGSEMATGKTLMAVETAKRRGSARIFIIAPNHTRKSWIKTFRRQGAKHEFYELNNKKTKISNAAWDTFRKKDPATKAFSESGIFFITRELFRAKAMNWTKDYVDMVIFDEAHAITGNRGDNAGFKQVRRLKRGFFLFQSATWFGAEFPGAREAARATWPELYTGSFNNWRDEWCETTFSPFTYDKLAVSGEKIPGAFAASLPCYVRLENTLSEPTYKEIYVDLHREQRKLYNEMEEEGMTWLGEHPLVADFPMVKDIRLKQITLGTCEIRKVFKNKQVPIMVFDDKGRLDFARDRQGNKIFEREGNDKDGKFVLTQVEEEEVYFDDDTISSKYDALLRFIAEEAPNEPLLITSDSTRFLNVLAPRMGAFNWSGGATEKQRDQAKEDFLAGKLKYIAAHPDAIGEGTDELQYVCHIIVRLSRSSKVVIEQQLAGRTNRPGQTKQPIIVDIMADDTRDDPQAITSLTKMVNMRKSVVALAS